MSTQLNVFEPPDFSGYLRKKGGNFKAYKKRWFELRGKNLFYFKAQGQKPAGMILLDNSIAEEDASKKFGFKIMGATLSRTYELQGDTDNDVKAWIAQVNKAANKNASSTAVAQTGASSASTASSSNGEEDREEMLFNGTNRPTQSIGLKDFDLLTVIGRGSFGKVMKVRKKDNGEIYAMKVLRKDMIIKENMVTHTKSEKSILQSVQHPFIVGLRYAFQTAEKLYLVLDFLSGGELFFHLKEETKFNEERAKFYTAEITMAIEHLHKNNIIYRDLKPENVVLDKYGHVCLTDFGLAKTHITESTPTYTFCGTPEYLAPEILKGQGHAKAVDWWSLGVLLYEMLVGLPPFYSENINEMYELILKAPLKFPSFVSPDAQTLLRGLLERDENRRLGSGRADGEEIRNHAFFSNIDWDALYKRQITPPFIPVLKDAGDTKYFDSEFTTERPIDSFAEAAKETGDANFDGFTFQGKSVLDGAN